MCWLQPKAATLIDFDHWLDSRVMAGAWAAPALPSASNANRQRTTKEREEKPPVNTRPPRIFNTTQSTTCVLCLETHALQDCSEFPKLSPKERSEFAFERKSCFRCLLVGHTSKGCPQQKPCTHENCKSYHHPLMHGAPRVTWSSPTQLNASLPSD